MSHEEMHWQIQKYNYVYKHGEIDAEIIEKAVKGRWRVSELLTVRT